jgi:hypothetical protein
MPVIKGHGKTNAEKREKLFDRISPIYLFTKTSVFSDPIGEPKLDQRTVAYIKAQYTNYFKSWVEVDARKFILNEKPKP